MLKNISYITFFVYLFFISTAYSETLILKTGDELEGTVLSETEDKITFTFQGSTLNLNKDEITSIQPSVVIAAEEEKQKEEKLLSEVKKKAVQNTPANNEVNVDEQMEYFTKFFGSKEAFKQAFEQYKKTAARNPANIENRYRLGLCYYYLGDYTKAINELNTVINNKADDFEAIRFLGYAYYQAGDLQSASIYLKKRLIAIPREDLTRFFLAETLNKLNDKENALIHYKELIKYEKHKYRALSQVILLYQQMGNTKKADKYMKILENIKSN